jgi:hypothetical protein
MQRKFHIARDDDELTALSESEVRDLLREGFLLPSDVYRTEGMKDWEALREFDAKREHPTDSVPLMELARQKASATGRAAANQASRLTQKLKSLAARGHSQLADSTSRLLEPFTPQIQKLVEHQLVKQSVTRVQAAVRDDEFMRKLFGATYDCLPKPVYRFVKEEAFIQFCMERRQRILGLPMAGEGSQPTLNL